MRGYAAQTVPAFVQTASYAEAFLKATRPELGAAEGKLVKLQLRRQRSLGLGGKSLTHPGRVGPAPVRRLAPVMAGQLAHLRTFTSQPSVIMCVIRLATAQSVLSRSFTLLSLPGTENSAVASWESIGGQVDVSRCAADDDAMQSTFEAGHSCPDASQVGQADRQVRG